MLMKRIGVKRSDMMKHSGDLCPNIEKILEENMKKAHNFKPIRNEYNAFNVEYSSTESYKVHLGEQTCRCVKWALTGIPCPHVICGMYYMGMIQHNMYMNAT